MGLSVAFSPRCHAVYLAATSGKPSYKHCGLWRRDDVILDERGDAVMMGWERPLMDAHAGIVLVV